MRQAPYADTKEKHREGLAPPPQIKIYRSRIHTGPTYIAGRNRIKTRAQNKTNADTQLLYSTRYYTVLYIDLPQPLARNKASRSLDQFNSVYVPNRYITLSLLADVLLTALNPLASRWRHTLDWRRSACRRAFSSDSAPFSTPRSHMPTFFAAVIQSRPSLTSSSNATHFRPLPLRGIIYHTWKYFVFTRDNNL